MELTKSRVVSVSVVEGDGVVGNGHIGGEWSEAVHAGNPRGCESHPSSP